MFDLKNKMKNYRFAISLNTYLYDDKNEYKISNGMSWESCSVKSNKCMEIISYIIYYNNIL